MTLKVGNGVTSPVRRNRCERSEQFQFFFFNFPILYSIFLPWRKFTYLPAHFLKVKKKKKIEHSVQRLYVHHLLCLMIEHHIS